MTVDGKNCGPGCRLWRPVEREGALIMAEPLFGRLMTAMVTPFDDQGQIDHGAATEVARWLVQEQCNDALVINGTGERRRPPAMRRRPS